MTFNQLLKHGRSEKKRPKKQPFTRKPQISAICVKVRTKTPKKPNSANRATAIVVFNDKVRLNGKNMVIKKRLNVAIHGEKALASVNEHGKVIITSGGFQDVPGVKRFQILRGVKDCVAPERNKGRSVFGVKKKK
jgi:small subunit ribosomal protein S12